MGETFVRGQIQVQRLPGGNVTIDTTHTVGGLIHGHGKASHGPHIEIESADLDDAIAALQALRTPPETGPCALGRGCVLSAGHGDHGDHCMRSDGTVILRKRPDAPCFHTVRPSPAALEVAERHPDLVRKIEEVNERMIAFLKERMPAPPRWPPPDYAKIERAPSLSAFVYPPSAPAQPGTLDLAGRWRVYFNKHGRADLPWCVAPDAGGWEIAVSTVEVTRKPHVHPPHQAQIVYDGEAILKTVYQPKATPDDEDGRPSAWIAVEGRLTVAGGRATIAATAAPEVQQP